MKPASFEYHRPQSLAEVFDCFDRLEGDVRLLAGGQSLVPMLNLRLARPDHLIDVNDLAELDYVRETDTAIEIGGLTRHHRVATDPQIKAILPILAAAAKSIGHYAIRQRGTLGGSLVHADPAAQLPLLAVLFDAELTCVSRGRQRTVRSREFFKSLMTTALDANEMLVSTRFSKLQPGTGWGFELFSRRQGDFAIVAAAALLGMDGHGRAYDLRLALGGVSPIPIRFDSVTEAFLGQRPDETWLQAISAAIAQNCAVEDDENIPAAFRKELAQALTHRALSAAIGRTRKAAD